MYQERHLPELAAVSYVYCLLCMTHMEQQLCSANINVNIIGHFGHLRGGRSACMTQPSFHIS